MASTLNKLEEVMGLQEQLATITDLSGKTAVSQRTEQLNRELRNRSEKLQKSQGQAKSENAEIYANVR